MPKFIPLLRRNMLCLGGRGSTTLGCTTCPKGTSV